MISLYIVACLSGTLHGEPRQLCREFQVRTFKTVEACETAMKGGAVEEWLKGMLAVGIAPDVPSVRCGPAEKEGDDL